jgi:hypothetical protein
MKAIWLSLIVIICFSCTSDKKKFQAEDFINENAPTIIRVNNVANLSTNLNNNDLLSQLNTSKSFKDLESTFELFSFLNTKHPIYINLFSAESFSFSTIYSDSILKLKSDTKITRDSISIEGLKVEKITLNNQQLFLSKRDQVIVGSNSEEKLKEALSHMASSEILKFLKTTNEKSELSIIKSEKKPFKSPVFIDSILNTKQLTNYLAFDVDLAQENILLNGISKASDSSKSMINIFKNTIAQENELALVTPNNSDGFLSITYNDYQIFKENLNKFNKKNTEEEPSTLLNNISEIGIIYNDSNALVLNSIDTEYTKTQLSDHFKEVETYRSIPIYNFEQPNFFKNELHPFFNSTVSVYCQLDQFFVFSNSKETLLDIIANYQNKTTLFYKDYYKAVSKQLSSQSSILQIVNGTTLARILDTPLQNNTALDLSNYRTSAVQFTYDDDFAHFNAVINKSKVVKEVNTISEKFNIKLDEDILNDPQFVKNHITNKTEILVQDVKNTLYLISNSGKILWKKTLKEEIIGKIEQVDLLKNGKLQYAFTTKKAMYVLDREGNDTKPFPVTLKDKVTQPLSVFEYEGRKNYRFLITQGKELLMLDAKGKNVNGFNYKKENAVTSQPKHFRIGSKDYIAFKAKDELVIIDRVGKIRIPIKEAFKFSENAIYLNQNKFTFTTEDGELVTVTESGKVGKQALNLNKNHGFDASTVSMTYLSENKLTINGKTIELDFGNYTKPQLFYSNDKIFVSTTDLQTQKLYLFDSKAKLINNFPVFATANSDLNNTNNLEIVTKGDTNSILFYTTN